MNLTDAAQAIREAQVEFPTPIRDLLAKLITDRDYTHGSRTSFHSTSIGIETHTSRQTEGERLEKVEVSLYGEFTFDGVTDQSAKVRIVYWFTQNMLSVYTQADRYIHGTFQSMPEGARNKIAGQVVQVLGTFHEWANLAWEDTNLRKHTALNRLLVNAAECLESADKQAKLLGVKL